MFKRIPSIPSRLDVVTCAAEYFGREDGAFIMEILDQYGTEENEPHREFIQMTAVRAARGNATKLMEAIEEAKHDWGLFLFKADMRDLKPLLDNGWDITPSIGTYWPPSRAVKKDEAAEHLGVDWKQIDEWVKEGKIKPCSTGPRNYRFAVEELERFQRTRFAVNIEEVWVKYQRGSAHE
jgi:excisionase family DNA binding protein